jgi:predicted RNA methylase
MTTAFPPCPKRIGWRVLYTAAILETNQRVLPQRVSEAETSVLARRREIFYADGTPEEEEEKEALEDALYALHAFRTASRHEAA